MNPEARDDLKMFRASGAFTRLCLCVQASRLRLVPEFPFEILPSPFQRAYQLSFSRGGGMPRNVYSEIKSSFRLAHQR